MHSSAGARQEATAAQNPKVARGWLWAGLLCIADKLKTRHSRAAIQAVMANGTRCGMFCRPRCTRMSAERACLGDRGRGAEGEDTHWYSDISVSKSTDSTPTSSRFSSTIEALSWSVASSRPRKSAERALGGMMGLVGISAADAQRQKESGRSERGSSRSVVAVVSWSWKREREEEAFSASPKHHHQRQAVCRPPPASCSRRLFVSVHAQVTAAINAA